MQTILIENREKIAELCRTHSVRRLTVFGSAVRDDFDPERSDVDLLVEFGAIDGARYVGNFFDFECALTGVLERRVDLIVAGSIKNPYLLRSMSNDQELLYAA